MWFNFKGDHLSDPENQVLMARGNPSGSAAHMCMLLMLDLTSNPGSPKVTFSLRPHSTEDLKSVTPNVTINENQWYHVVATYTGAPNGQQTGLSVHINDPVSGNNNKSAVSHYFSDNNFESFGNFDLNIGFWDIYATTKYPFNGELDEVLFYNKALSDTEINTIFNEGSNGTPHCKPGNYYPLITSDPVTDAWEDDLYTYTITAQDFEDEPITFTGVTIPSWLTFNATTGVLSGTPTNEDIDDHNVKIQVTDGSIDNLFQEFTITVNNQNDPPVITSTPSVTTIDQGESFSYTLTATDADADDVITFSAPGLPSWMSFDAGTGVLSGTPTNDQVQLSPDSTFDITLVATDKADATDTQEFTLTVNNVNDKPQIISQSSVTIDRNTTVDISLGDLVVNDPDDAYPGSHSLIVFEGNDYTFSGSTITPADNFYGDLVVNIGISDGVDTTNYGFQITVSFVNIVPEFTSTPKLEATEGSAYSYAVRVDDPDVDDPSTSQELTFTAPVLPAWLEFDTETQILVGIPGRDAIGDNNVSIQVSDGIEEVTQEFTIVVDSDNNAPIVISTPPQQVNNYAEYSYTMIASDADASDVLTYSAVLVPSWLTFDPSTQILSGTPQKSDVGTHNVTLSVTDGLDVTEHSFTITVLDVNTKPEVISTPVDTARANRLYTYLLEVVDNEGDPLVYTPTLIPTWLEFNSTSKVLSGTPTTDDMGEHTVIITVTDGVFTLLHQFTVEVVREYPIGIDDFEGSLSTNVYPNPASEYVIFELKGNEACTLEITDITGKVVVKEHIERNVSQFRIDMSELDKGIYIYRLSDGKKDQSGKLMLR
jgi:hypothetical protein